MGGMPSRQKGSSFLGSRSMRDAQPRHRHSRLELEQLETRTLLSVSVGLLRNLNLQPASSNPYGFTSIGAITYFEATDGIHGNSLWRTDGTSAGTYMVKDLTFNGGIYQLGLNFNGRILFQVGT